jgi:hypothetical protein
VLQLRVVSRRPFTWLSGFAALVVLLASIGAGNIRPHAADPLAWRGDTNARTDLEVVTSADRSDARLLRTLSARGRLPGVHPATASPWSPFSAFLFALPVAPSLPAPQTGRAQPRAWLVLAPASFRPGACSARGPPRRAFA